MYNSNEAREELERLSRRKRGLAALFRRYIMGLGAEEPLSPAELKAQLNWQDGEKAANERRLGIIREELIITMEGLREQFAKVATLIAALAFMVGFGLTDDKQGTAVRGICIAAIIGVWVQSPRLKIFRFRKRLDSGLRIGKIGTSFEEYYYLYAWLNKREELLHAAEVLVFILSVATIGALAYLAVVI